MEELVVLDADGQVSEAIPPAGAPAWGVAQNLLAVFRDSSGRIDIVRGDLGEAQVVYDPLGRIAAVGLSEEIGACNMTLGVGFIE